MRIAHFSDCFTPRISGVTTSIQALQTALLEAGHQVTLFAPHYPDHRDDHLPVVRLPSWWLHRQVAADYDVLHAHTPLAAGWLAWRSRTPLVFTHHTLWEDYAHYLKGVPPRLGRWTGQDVQFLFSPGRSRGLTIQRDRAGPVKNRIHGCYRASPQAFAATIFRGAIRGPFGTNSSFPRGLP